MSRTRKQPLELRPDKAESAIPVLKSKFLSGGSLKESDYLVRRFTALIPTSHTLKDVEAPKYFQFYVDQLAKARSSGPVKLEVLSHDCSVHAEYLVLEATRANIMLRRIAVHHDASALPELMSAETQEEDSPPPQYAMSWSASQKWRITSYGEIVFVNIHSQEGAQSLVDRLNAGTIKLDEVPSEYSVKKDA